MKNFIRSGCILGISVLRKVRGKILEMVTGFVLIAL